MFYKFKQSPDRLKKKIIVATVEEARWCLVSIASNVILYKSIYFFIIFLLTVTFGGSMYV